MWTHTLSDTMRLVVGHDTDLDIDWALDCGMVAVQDITNRDSLKYRHSPLVTEDKHLGHIETILDWHGGYYSAGCDNMEEAIAKHLKRAGLFHTFKTLHAYTQGSQKRVVLYGREDWIESSDFTELQNLYAGDVYWLRLEQRPVMCECGCLDDWEAVDSLGGLFLDNPEDRESVLSEARAYFNIEEVKA